MSIDAKTFQKRKNDGLNTGTAFAAGILFVAW
jgi:hypothetical protein